MQTNQTSQWYVQSKECWNTGIAGSNSAQDINVQLCFLVFVWSCAGGETNQSLSKELYQLSICRILEIP